MTRTDGSPTVSSSNLTTVVELMLTYYRSGYSIDGFPMNCPLVTGTSSFDLRKVRLHILRPFPSPLRAPGTADCSVLAAPSVPLDLLQCARLIDIRYR